MELGTLGIALLVVVGVPLITAGYAFLTERLLKLVPERRRASYRPWLWLAPAFAFLVAYLIYPTIPTFFLSFQNRDSTEFVGLDNYTRLFGTSWLLADAAQHRRCGSSSLPAVVVILGLIIAVLADRVRYETVVKALIFVPLAISFVAAGVIWNFMYDFNPARGTLNAGLGVVGLEPQSWMTEWPRNTFMLILVGIWMWVGFATVILSAGLKGISAELLEAARMDGATELQVFFRIILPLLAPTIAVVGHHDRDHRAEDVRHRLRHDRRPATAPRSSARLLHAAASRTMTPASRQPSPSSCCSRSSRSCSSTSAASRPRRPSDDRRRRRRRRRRPAARGGLPGGGRGWFGRVPLHTALILVCLIWLLPTVSLFVSSLRPANEVLTTRLVERLPAAVRVHARQLPGRADREQHGAELPQQPVHHDPGHDHPDPGRGLRRLRLRLDGLPGPECALHPGRRPPGDPAPVRPDPGPAVQHQLGITGTFPAVWLAHTGFGLPFAIFLLRNFFGRAAQGDVRIGLPRWRVAHDRLLPAGAAAIGAGDRVAGHLPVHVRLERPAGRADPRGRHRGCRSDDGHDRQPGELARPGLAPADAAAFISMVLPLVVFFGLQRYFVRGILGGSVKG